MGLAEVPGGLDLFGLFIAAPGLLFSVQAKRSFVTSLIVVAAGLAMGTVGGLLRYVTTTRSQRLALVRLSPTPRSRLDWLLLVAAGLSEAAFLAQMVRHLWISLPLLLASIGLFVLARRRARILDDDFTA